MLHAIRYCTIQTSSFFLTSSVVPGRSDVRETAFWRNYFFQCEKAQKRRLQRCKKSNESPDASTSSASEKLQPLGKVKVEFEDDGGTFSVLDDSSLVPASVADDSSYVNVIPSAPEYVRDNHICR
jgi:hypothetical protein